MTIKQTEFEIENGNIPEAEIARIEQRIDASQALASDMYQKLEGLALKKYLRDFLESKHLADTAYEIITHSCEANVHLGQKLRSKDLKLLKNRKFSTKQLVEINEKLRIGMRMMIKENPDPRSNAILFQGLLVKYLDVYTNNLETEV